MLVNGLVGLGIVLHHRRQERRKAGKGRDAKQTGDLKAEQA
jgi:hypothetical protein